MNYNITINGDASNYTLSEKSFLDTLAMCSYFGAQIITIACNTIVNFTNGDQHIMTTIEEE